MKRGKLEFVPVGKRTRLQCRLREKELSEKNKKVRLARSKRRKVYAEENKLDSKDVSDGEDVKVIYEAEYLRHLALLEYRECSPDVAVVVFEENIDNSAHLVGGISNPLGKRTKLQCRLREELSERNKKVQLAARRKRRKVYAEENKLDSKDDSDGEDVKVVDEAEYLRHLALLEYRECSPDVAVVVFEENIDNSAHLVGGISNPLRIGFDNDKDNDDVFEGCTALMEVDDIQFSGMKPGSEATCGGGDGGQSSGMHQGFEGGGDVLPMLPYVSENDTNSVASLDDDNHKLSDEDFEVDEAEIRNIFSPEYSSPEDGECGKKIRKSNNNEDELFCVIMSDADHDIVDEHIDNADHGTVIVSDTNHGIVDAHVDNADHGTVVVSDVDHGIVDVDNVDHGTVIVSDADHGIVDNRLEKNSDEEIQKKLDDNELYVQLLFKSGEYGSNINQSESESPKSSNTEKEPENNNMGKKPEPEPENNYMGKEPVSEPENNNMGKEPESEPKSKSKILLMLPKKSNEAINSVCMSPKKSNEAVSSSPRKNNEVANSTLQKKKRYRKLKPNEAETIMLSTILENRNAGLNSCVHSVTVSVSEKSVNLPLKFRFGVQNTPPEDCVEDQDTENLFRDLEFALRTCDIGGQTSFGDEHDDVNPCDNAVEQENLCREGKHYLIHDDEIGIRCKYCSLVKLEIRHVTPAFNKNPFGRDRSRNYGQVPSDNATALTGSNLPDCNADPASSQSNNIQGTVWELIPGVLETLYPHQQEAFEFMWRNIEGGIKLDELGNPTKFGSGGCIICHAPGTGKTRLAITFLLSFIRKYPMSKPVIIAPKSMLLTWEEEFARWNIDVPFININKPELSGNEDFEVLKYVENVKNLKTIRVAKLYTWAVGKGILGISYTLFEKLAGDRKGADKQIRRALLEQPGILVLDEGHTPRNDQSNIWNVLNDVKTKRRIILSGTPFQNNFEELINTVSLVREEFENPLLPGKRMKCARNSTARRGLMDCNVDNDRRIAMLKNRMKPFLHVHKGEILKKTLRGLFHSVLLLKPSDLQKICFQQLNALKNGLKLDHLVSIASVHPSLLHSCDQIPDSLKVSLKNHRRHIEAGVKIRFLFDLINLAQGEKILVFSQFLPPLKLIRNLLKFRYHWAEEKELLYMDGKQDVRQRQAFIRHFNNPKSEARVLLASTKACCEGIHLVGASRVVLLDVVWNPSVERQAISRAYRLGQKKDVFVYHLITSGTQEEEKYYWQVTKDRVSEKVFSSEIESKQNVGMIPRVSEDRILEAMIQNEKIRNMFVKIIYQPKADELIESFGPVNL